MADEPRVIQPLVVMQPPVDPVATYDDEQASRFIEDTEVKQYGSFQEWLADNRPIPTPSPDQGIPESDVPD